MQWRGSSPRGTRFLNKREAWLLIAPALAVYLVFNIVPIAMSFIGSMVDGGSYGEGWIGLAAWKEVFASARFWQAIGTTMLFTVVLVPLTMVLIVAASVVLSWASGKLRSFGRLAFYVPTVTSAMMISIIWRWALAPNGLINRVLGTDILFIGSNPAAFWSICAMVVSMTLGAPIIYLMAAFATIDPELYDAAKLDGCGPWQEARHVTLPGVGPVLLYLVVLRLTGTIQLWQFPYSVTGGGPNYGTNTLMLMTYQEAFVHTRIPQASVMSAVLVVMVCGLLVLSRVITKQKVLG